MYWFIGAAILWVSMGVRGWRLFRIENVRPSGGLTDEAITFIFMALFGPIALWAGSDITKEDTGTRYI